MRSEIKNADSLKERIATLEKSKMAEKEQLAHSFHQKGESLKPGNLLKSSLYRFQSTPTLKTGLLLAGAGIGTVILIKKLLTKPKVIMALGLMAARIIAPKLTSRLKNKSNEKL